MNQTENQNSQERVCCLPGYENFDTVEISKRIPKVFYLKSTEILREEQRKKKGVIIWKNAG